MRLIREIAKPTIIFVALVMFLLFASVGSQAQPKWAQEPQLQLMKMQYISLYQAGRYHDAAKIAAQAVALSISTFGENHIYSATILNDLALLYEAQGRYAESELLYKRSLNLREGLLSPEDSEIATSLSNLAGVYRAQGRYAEAEPLISRALRIDERALGPEHPRVATALNNIGLLYQNLGRYVEAETILKRALRIRKKTLGENHPYVGTTLNNLALLYHSWERYADAETNYMASLEIISKRLGDEHPAAGTSIINLGSLYQDQGHYVEAEVQFERARRLMETALGQKHPYVGTALRHLGGLFFVQEDWSKATDHFRRGSRLITRHRAKMPASEDSQENTPFRENDVRSRLAFYPLIKAAHRLSLQDHDARTDLAHETFQAAQGVLGSQAGVALARMAARQAKGDSGLAILIRERQDLVSEWQARDKLNIDAVALEPGERNKQLEAQNLARLHAIDERLAEIDERLTQEFPNYVALANPQPLSVSEVQELLDPDEALIAILDTPNWTPVPEETFIWLVTKDEFRWARSELGSRALSEEVRALRCGLDFSNWRGEAALACASRLGISLAHSPQARGDKLPFDLHRSYRLYKSLLGEIETQIREKHLIIVPSSTLMQLPFHTLVTQEPAPSTSFSTASWLIRHHAITVLPAVTSLASLRRIGRPSRAAHPIIGIGNPLLDGASNGTEKERANRARERQDCQFIAGQNGEQISLATRSNSAQPLVTYGGLANVSDIRKQAPLPESAYEICKVADELWTTLDDKQSIFLGKRATEHTIKQLNAQGALSAYRVVHFATHGLVAGQLGRAREPGLILTPPRTASVADDGYLTASEISELKLDANWVILSACNTAAGESKGAEALSGLARAFFFAQSRALLVSHWEVYSSAAVELITAAVGRSSKVGRAQALREAMLRAISLGEHRAWPEYWAPFVVIGEGSR